MKKTLFAILLAVPLTAVVATIGWATLPSGLLKDKAKDVAIDEVVDRAMEHLEVPKAKRSAVKARLAAAMNPAERIEEAFGAALAFNWVRHCWPDVDSDACAVASDVTARTALQWAQKREWPKAFQGLLQEAERLGCDGSSGTLDAVKAFLAFDEMAQQDTTAQQAAVFKQEVLTAYACNYQRKAKR